MGNVCQKRPEVIRIHPKSKKDKQNISDNNERFINNFEKINNKLENKKNNNYLLKTEQAKLQNLKTNQYNNDKIISSSNFNSPNKSLKKYNNEFLKGQCIGNGYFSSVFFGLSCITGEIVAIQKILLTNIKSKKIISVDKQINLINKAVHEYSSLNHNNIIKYFRTQLSENLDEIEILLEFCNGGSIKQLLDKFNSFDEKLIKLYTKQILEGLIYLHENEIFHRNLKNTNILVDGNGTIKISDMLISNVLIGDDYELILEYLTKNFKESPFWIAPELINKDYKIGPSLDIWNLGCIIIEMATNTPPWSNLSKSDEEILKLISESSIPPKFPSHVSKECKSFLSCCLQKNPQNRWSAKKLIEHPFFKTNTSQIESSDKNSSKSRPIFKSQKYDKNEELNNNSKNYEILHKTFSSEEVIIDKSQIEIEKATKDQIYTENKLGLLLSNKANKIATKNIIIKEKEEGKENKNEIASKNLVNILADNSETKNNPLFSVTMTVFTDQSEIPQTLEFINKTNLIIDKIEGKNSEEKIDNKYNKINNTIKVENIIEENDEKANLLEDSNLDSSLKNILENYKLSMIDINNKENFEKLGTLHMSEEEAKRLEKYFLNKHSIII